MNISHSLKVTNSFFRKSSKVVSNNAKKDLKLSSIKVVGLMLGFGTQIILTRVIGVKQYGIYVLFSTWTNFLSIILVLGYDRLIIKELSFHYMQNNREDFRSVLDKLSLYIFINSAIFILLASFVPQQFLIQTFFSKDFLRSTWFLILVGTITSTVFVLFGKVLSATQQVELNSIRSEISYRVILLATVLLLYFYVQKVVGVNIIIVGVILAYIATIVIFIIIDRRKISQYLSIKRKKIFIGKENYVFFFTTLNYLLITQSDKIIIGKFASLEVLGVYGLVSTLIILISFSTIVYNRFLPKISNYIRSNNFIGLEKDFKTTTRNSLMIALPFMMFLLVFTDDILLFFGEKFVAGTAILRVLIWGQMAQFFTGPNGNLLINGRHAKIDLANSAVIGALTVLLNIAGYKYYGVMGVAAASSFGFALVNIVKVIEVKIFYKIFPYEYKNILVTLIVFFSFYFIKTVNLNIQNLVARLFTNFSLSLLTSLLAVAMLYMLRERKFNYQAITKSRGLKK